MSISQLSRLLPLPNSELQQVLEYASTLSKAEAVEHFSNLLGDSSQVVEFVSSFNAKRDDPKSAAKPSDGQSGTSTDIDAVPKAPKHQKKKKTALHAPAPRKVDSLGPTPGLTYQKKNQRDDYISSRPTAANNPPPRVSNASPKPGSSSAATGPSQKPRPSAGYLISDGPEPKGRPKSNPVSRASTPKPSAATTKVSIAGGTPMTGASAAIADLDAAIRSLEISTNPSLQGDSKSRRCNCVATRHPLQSAAPNCLSCGKVICVKEGLGPCTYCGEPILSSTDVQAMVRELKLERGREKMAADREAHRRPEVSKVPAAFTQSKDYPELGNGAGTGLTEAAVKAREHRDKLLAFQAQNAQRTTIRDEAADFDASGALAGHGGSMWATAEDRAKELKRQQKLLREIEWNARPEYEKRRQVVSIDLVGGKVVKKMAAVERPPSPEEEAISHDSAGAPAVLQETTGNRPSGSGGAFGSNPLLGGLIKPVYNSKGKAADVDSRHTKKSQWRRVQDQLEDNESVILDGGAYGFTTEFGKGIDQIGRGDEPNCG
jgi:hypothetical protein